MPGSVVNCLSCGVPGSVINCLSCGVSGSVVNCLSCGVSGSVVNCLSCAASPSNFMSCRASCALQSRVIPLSSPLDSVTLSWPLSSPSLAAIKSVHDAHSVPDLPASLATSHCLSSGLHWAWFKSLECGLMSVLIGSAWLLVESVLNLELTEDCWSLQLWGYVWHISVSLSDDSEWKFWKSNRFQKKMWITDEQSNESYKCSKLIRHAYMLNDKHQAVPETWNC